MKYELAIFDLDGTLIDTAEDLGAAANHALGLAGLPQHSLNEYRKMVGHGVRNLIISACPEEYREDKSFIDRRLEDFLTFYIGHIDVHSRPYKGICSLIGRLKHSGCICAVASNKFQDGTQRLVQSFFPEGEFAVIYGNRSGVPLKPNPEVIDRIITEAAALSGKSEAELRENCVMIGDASTDVNTAKAAGVASIGVSWGFKAREELIDADHIADSAEQLAELLSL